MKKIFRTRFLVPVAVFAAAAITALAPAITSAAGESGSVAIHDGGDPTGWGYGPSSITIGVGQSVTFTNSGTSPHDATALDGSWKTPLLQGGQSASVTFATAGNFDFTCILHPWMKGTVIVAPAVSAPAPAPAPVEISAPAPAPAAAPVDVAPVVSPAPQSGFDAASSTDDEPVVDPAAGSGN
jgi:plastocyanin